MLTLKFMAPLSKKARDKLPARDFAGPDRSFPIEDKEHARKAKQLAPKSERAGNISRAQEERIEAKAEKKLHGKKDGKK